VELGRAGIEKKYGRPSVKLDRPGPADLALALRRGVGHAISLIVTLFIATLLNGAAVASPRIIGSAPVGDGLNIEYFVSAPPGAPVKNILIVIHGYPRDADRTYDAAATAASHAGRTADTLIVAPIFQVPMPEAAKCQFHGVPAAMANDALWHCDDWSNGSRASNGPVSSFGAMNDLQVALLKRYPTAHTITIAGFSAGGQYVQHYIGFASPPAGIKLRYVVSDPSAFVYFDPWRPRPGTAQCPGYDNWKFGTQALPADLGRSAPAARATYIKADIAYLEGALDTGSGPGTSYRLLEKSCGAKLQGLFRLQRGQAYAAYDARFLAHGAHPLTVVPGCAHAVNCVFTAPGAAAPLFGAGAP
jgi:hypothetical protein